MIMDNKKFLILISTVAAIIAIAFGIIFYFSLRGGNQAATAPQGRELTDFGANPVAGGTPEAGQPQPATPETPAAGGTNQTPSSNFRKISNLPIAGFTAFEKEAPGNSGGSPATTGTVKISRMVTALRYASALDGNIYETFADNIAENKISSTQIFGVHDAVFGNNGHNVVLRYLKEDGKTIESFLENIPSDASIPATGSFLPENILSLSASPDGKNIFYIFQSGDGVVGINSSIDGGRKIQIFDSPFTEWLASWSNARLISMATKPSFSSDGFLYSLDPSSGPLDKILGGIAGLTAQVSPSGKFVLYADSSLAMKLYDISNKTSKDLGVKTEPEKCVWSQDNINVYCAVPQSLPAGNYPDSWYQGLVSFNDSIWKINTETDSFSLLLNPSSAGENMDGINLELSQKENHLFLINKKDSTLWGLGL
jgi:hypothetical protein